MKHIWSILCRNSVVDSTTNNVSLFDVLEQLKVNFPLEAVQEGHKIGLNIPIDYNMVSLWSRDEEESGMDSEIEGILQIEILDPDKKVIVSHEVPLKIEKNKKRVRAFIQFKGLRVTNNGIYEFQIRQKRKSGESRIEAVLPLDVAINFVPATK